MQWNTAMLHTSHAAEFDFCINLQSPVGRGTPDLMLFNMSNIHLLWREIKHLLKLQESIEPATVIIIHTHLAQLIQFLKHSRWSRRVCNLINSRALNFIYFYDSFQLGRTHLPRIILMKLKTLNIFFLSSVASRSLSLSLLLCLFEVLPHYFQILF